MPKVRVSSNRSLVGLTIVVIATIFLAYLILSGLQTPETPIIAEQPTSQPTPAFQPQPGLPAAYTVNLINNTISIFDPHTQTPLAEYGYATDIAVHKQTLIIVDDDVIRAVDLLTGKELWNRTHIVGMPDSGMIMIKPLEVAISGEQLIVTAYTTSDFYTLRMLISAYDLADGNRHELRQEVLGHSEAHTSEMLHYRVHPDFPNLHWEYTATKAQLLNTTSTSDDLVYEDYRGYGMIVPMPGMQHWYALDHENRLWQLPADGPSDDEFIAQEVSLAPELHAMNISEMVATPNRIFFVSYASRSDENATIFCYDIKTRTTTRTQISRGAASHIDADEIGGGIWIDGHHYWDGQQTKPIKAGMFAQKALSIAPIKPQPIEFTVDADQAPPTPQWKRARPTEAEPFIWIWSSLQQPTWQALNTDGTISLVADSAISGFKRPGKPPLLMLTEPQPIVYFPETNKRLTLDLSFMPIDFEWYQAEYYSFNQTETQLAFRLSAIDARPSDTATMFHQLAIIDLTSGSVTFNDLSDELNDSWQVIGWGASGIILMQNQTQLTLFNPETTEQTPLFESALPIRTTIFEPQFERLLMGYKDMNSGYYALFNSKSQIFNNNIDLSSASFIEFNPDGTKLMWIETTEAGNQNMIVYNLERNQTTAYPMVQPLAIMNTPYFLEFAQHTFWQDNTTVRLPEATDLGSGTVQYRNYGFASTPEGIYHTYFWEQHHIPSQISAVNIGMGNWNEQPFFILDNLDTYHVVPVPASINLDRVTFYIP